jgi:aryl-alcohol dehydrogenase-like predicted oxidoreductase
MNYKSLGRSGIQVSEIGFGCWTMGGPNWSLQTGQPIGWADVNDQEVLAGVRVGLDHGVNHWDNADIYGNGRAERTLATLLRTIGVKRDTQIIATKVGHFRGTAPHAYHPAHIRSQCEQSLRNLRTDYIDIYYFHHGTYIGPGFNAAGDLVPDHDYLHEAADTMHALVKEGKVRAIGQSAYSDADFERAIPVLKPHVLQSKANLRYDPFVTPGCRLEALCRQHGCSFVAFGPLDQGILLDKFDPDRPPAFDEGDARRNRKDFNPDTLRDVRRKLAVVRSRFARPGEDTTAVLASIAQRWLLAHGHVCSVIPGFRNATQALCNVSAASQPPLSQEDVSWLRSVFHTPPAP